MNNIESQTKSTLKYGARTRSNYGRSRKLVYLILVNRRARAADYGFTLNLGGDH